jgi:hypothetical protein
MTALGQTEQRLNAVLTLNVTQLCWNSIQLINKNLLVGEFNDFCHL